MFAARSSLLLIFTALLSFLPLTLASAVSQYHLDVTSQPSSCFVECHERLVVTMNLPGKGANSVNWIKENCQYDGWVNLMSLCLPMICNSPPSIAYAIEYGESFCSRAGAKNVVIPIPESYMESINGTYFKSEQYLESGANIKITTSATIVATLVGVAFLGICL
ncbi:hypothetical protein CI109_102301 [Kwoniella shandongensis]|uniref:Uncharacterized protein n=1 Tax=Kwoniella shandongensis TaxID=1734106 RepID=A0A5M6BQY9_9TREE|nr:uncharacterized protein CI109_007131 [Kwoniella shandongensis]KAA5524531.1 hypothetical protein CI109_007131 [Kwoniella shandongensis]